MNTLFLGLDYGVVSSLKNKLDIQKVYTVGLKKDFNLLEDSSFLDFGIHYSHSQMKANIYPALEKELLPLDEIILSKLAECEQIFLGMADRLFIGASYRKRYRLYTDHVKFWYNFFLQKKISLIFAANVPHEGYDYVLYMVATAIFKIRFIGAYVLPIRPGLITLGYLWHNLNRHSSTQKHFSNFKISSSSALISYYDHYGDKKTFEPFHRKKNTKQIFFDSLKSNAKRDTRKIIKAFKEKTILRKIINRLTFSNPDRIQNASDFYFENKGKVDKFYNKNSEGISGIKNKKFIYFPLHYQPEASTSPLGGFYSSQELVCDAVSHFMPEDCILAVKEHPRGSKAPNIRNIDFYKRILSCKNTILIKKNEDPNFLLNNSFLNISITGSSIMESILLSKPVMMFGSRFFENAPGVFRINSNEDISSAFNQLKTLSEGDLNKDKVLKYFSKIQGCVFNYVVSREDMMLSDGVTLEESNANYINAVIHLLHELDKKTNHDS